MLILPPGTTQSAKNHLKWEFMRFSQNRFKPCIHIFQPKWSISDLNLPWPYTRWETPYLPNKDANFVSSNLSKRTFLRFLIIILSPASIIFYQNGAYRILDFLDLIPDGEHPFGPIWMHILVPGTTPSSKNHLKWPFIRLFPNCFKPCAHIFPPKLSI